MKWALTYSIACIGFIAAILALLWAANGFSTAGMSLHGVVAIGLGVGFSVTVAVALMALVFYSNRSGRDEQVHRRHDRLREKGRP
jgi:hypothetical protein